MSGVTQCTPWLPASCLTSRRAAEPFERMVASWSGEWFGKNGWQVLGTWDAVGRPNAKDWAVLRDAARLQIKGKPQALQSLALALLNTKKQPNYTEQDLRLMRRVAAKALDDLQARIEGSLGSDTSTPSAYSITNGASYSLLIGMVGGAQLAVECGSAELVQIVRQSFPTSASFAELASRSDGYSHENIPVAASLGQSSLTVEQIEQLEIGDIIVLDRPAEDPAMLTIDDKATTLPFTLSEAGGKVTLELQEVS